MSSFSRVLIIEISSIVANCGGVLLLLISLKKNSVSLSFETVKDTYLSKDKTKIIREREKRER